MNTVEKSIGSPRARTPDRLASAVYAIAVLVAAACGDTYNSTVINHPDRNNGDEQGETSGADAGGAGGSDGGAGNDPQLDSDSDGLPDSIDPCPFSGLNEQVDTDDDGVADMCVGEGDDNEDAGVPEEPTADAGLPPQNADAGADAEVLGSDLGADSGVSGNDAGDTSEICGNGEDDNRNGTVDETPCENPDRSAEECDGVDNNMNGVVDEGC